MCCNADKDIPVNNRKPIYNFEFLNRTEKFVSVTDRPIGTEERGRGDMRSSQ